MQTSTWADNKREQTHSLSSPPALNHNIFLLAKAKGLRYPGVWRDVSMLVLPSSQMRHTS